VTGNSTVGVGSCVNSLTSRSTSGGVLLVVETSLTESTGRSSGGGSGGGTDGTVGITTCYTLTSGEVGSDSALSTSGGTSGVNTELITVGDLSGEIGLSVSLKGIITL